MISNFVDVRQGDFDFDSTAVRRRIAVEWESNGVQSKSNRSRNQRIRRHLHVRITAVLKSTVSFRRKTPVWIPLFSGFRRTTSRPASRCGTETWPDLRLKWPQVDHRRLDHIRLDLTWQQQWLESTSNDFRSCDELAWTLCIDSFMYSIMTLLSCAGFAAAALFSWLSVLVLFMGQGSTTTTSSLTYTTA